MEELKEKKERGEIDARFIDGEQDKVRQRYVSKERIEKGLLVNHESMLQRQVLLQKRFQVTPRPVEVHLPIDFKVRHAQLERLFKK